MKKPKFLFYNVGGDFLGIQMRIQKEGYETVAYYDPEVIKGKEKAGCGLIETVDDPFDVINEYHDHPDDLIVIIDDNSKGSICDFLRSKGFPVIGSSERSDKYEHDRGDGNRLAKKIGLSLPPTHEFSEFEAGYEFLSKCDPQERFVFKADGAALAGSSKTYVGKSVEDVDRFMRWVQSDQQVHGYQVEKFELQEVVSGVEVDVAAWFNGEEFADTAAVTFEQKKIHGLGAAQGCMGQVLTYQPLAQPYAGYFDKLKDEIKGSGPNEWAINAIVSHEDHTPCFLEWTPRFGWDSTFGELALLQDAGIPISQLFIRLAYGKPIPKSWLPIGRYSAGARVFSESPEKPGKDVCGKPLWIDPSIEDNVWFYSVKKEEGQEGYVLTDNPFCVVTACGDTPEEACARLYAMLDPEEMLITTPDIFYSETIGENVTESLRKLKSYGVLDDY